MTKKEIVRTISEEIGLTQLQTKEIVQKTFNAIVEALVEEGRIELRNFGVFEVKRRAPARPAIRERAIKFSFLRNTSSPSNQAKRWRSAFENSNAKPQPGRNWLRKAAVQLRKNTAQQRVTTTRPMTVHRTRTRFPSRWPRGHVRTLRCFPAAAFFSSCKSQLRP